MRDREMLLVLREIRDLLKTTPKKKKGKKEQQHKTLPCPFNLEAVYVKYPRRGGNGKGVGLARLASQELSRTDYVDLIASVENYAKQCRINQTEQKFIMLFSTYANRWRDFIPNEQPKAVIEPISGFKI